MYTNLKFFLSSAEPHKMYEAPLTEAWASIQHQQIRTPTPYEAIEANAVTLDGSTCPRAR